MKRYVPWWNWDDMICEPVDWDRGPNWTEFLFDNYWHCYADCQKRMKYYRDTDECLTFTEEVPWEPIRNSSKP